MSSVKVLYEDNHIIAVVKPAGVLTQGDRTGEVSLYDMVKDYIREKKGKPTLLKPGNALPREAYSGSEARSGVFLGLVHRLDKPVQGIVLFGKTSKGAARLSEQFRNHTIQKTYHAIVVGKMEQQKGEIKEKVNKISFFAEGFTNKTDDEHLQKNKKKNKKNGQYIYGGRGGRSRPPRNFVSLFFVFFFSFLQKLLVCFVCKS